jgi:hypothetical protein
MTEGAYLVTGSVARSFPRHGGRRLLEAIGFSLADTILDTVSL